MIRLIILTLITLLASGSYGGYLYLTIKINEGQLKIITGEQQLADGQRMLQAGKARLAAGRRKMRPVNQAYRQVNNIPIIGGIARELPVSSLVLSQARGMVSQGNSMIAQGAAKIRNGEQRLAEGKIELQNGKDRLHFVNNIRIACMISGIFLTILLLGLAYHWRQCLHFRFAQKLRK